MSEKLKKQKWTEIKPSEIGFYWFKRTLNSRKTIIRILDDCGCLYASFKFEGAMFRDPLPAGWYSNKKLEDPDE